LKNYFEPIKLYSSVYPYNSLALKIIARNFGTDTSGDNGYYALKGSLENESRDTSMRKANTKVDPIYLNALKEFIQNAKENNIPLFICFSPMYRKIPKENYSVILGIMKKSNTVQFMNYLEDTTFLYPNYFTDQVHLNEKGSRLFSQKVASDIKAMQTVTHESSIKTIK